MSQVGGDRGTLARDRAKEFEEHDLFIFQSFRCWGRPCLVTNGGVACVSQLGEVLEEGTKIPLLSDTTIPLLSGTKIPHFLYVTKISHF